MFDPSDVTFAGVNLLITIFGLVEFVKNIANMEGKQVTVLAAIMGAIIFVLVELANVFGDPYAQILTVAIRSLVFGLAASGYYKFINQRLPKQG